MEESIAPETASFDLDMKKGAIAVAFIVNIKRHKINRKDMKDDRRIHMEFPDCDLKLTLIELMRTKYMFDTPYRVVSPDQSQ